MNMIMKWKKNEQELWVMRWIKELENWFVLHHGLNWIWKVKNLNGRENKRIRREYKNKYRMKWINWIWTDNYIGDEGAKMISEILKTNTTLTKLDLCGDE